MVSWPPNRPPNIEMLPKDLMTDSAHKQLMKTIYEARLCFLAAVLLFCISSPLMGQSGTQLPAPTNHINDFGGVLDQKTKNNLEVLLHNLKEKTKVEFYVATVDTTGGRDIFDFSRQLAAEWNLGARNSTSKSLLLVIAISSKTSFTQFSKSMQASLPEGVLGEMAQRMRSPLSAGRFSEATEAGVWLFVNAMGQKLGFVPQDLATTSSNSVAKIEEQPPDRAESIPVSSTGEQTLTRRRVVSETKPVTEKLAEQTPQTDTPQPVSQPQTQPTSTDAKPAEAEPTPNGERDPAKTTEKKSVEATPESNNEAAAVKPAEKKSAEASPASNSERSPVKSTAKTARNRPRTDVRAPKPAATQKQTEPVSEEDEEEEVELTLTLPLAKRAEKLKSFLDTHPDSKFRGRATELLISTHAGLGDQYLKNSDVENGIKHLMLAIDEADVTISEKLFSGVISQIPSNLYLRGQSDAAFKAASTIETKFGADPNRLLSVAAFYAGLERGDEAARIAEQAIKLAPENAEAHRVLALGRHLNLQIDEAAAEYKRTVELAPTSRASKTSLADLTRAGGKPEEALAIYNELLQSDPKDRTATAGMIICLLELGRTDEATTALTTALAAEPKNLALLSGVAYWYAAHGNYEKGADYASKALTIESRYTWAQIAFVRSLIGLKRPVPAERAMRYARQFGKFPTLTYELANVVASMGFYDEAAEILRESFTFKDGQIETLLAGRIPARESNFADLLAPERRASIYQPTAADSTANANVLKDLLALDSSLRDSDQPDEKAAAKAAGDFASGNDPMRTFRQFYAANRLLKKTTALPTALELVEDAKKSSEVALNLSVATTAVQAEEFRDLRAQAIANGNVPEVEAAPPSALANLLRGRLEDITGWILFNQDKYPEAIEHLKLAASTLPNGTPAWRNALWHLGVAYEQTGKTEAALTNYIESYKVSERDPLSRATIEKLYRKVYGSLEGLDDKIGAASTTRPSQTESAPATTPPETATKTTTETAPVETAKPEEKPASKPETTPEATTPTTLPAPSPSQPISEEALRAAASRLRANIKITGRVVDADKIGMPNVVVVLISPSGSVIAATTDNQGNYSFTIAPSPKTYRVIPSKDGYSFSPVDKTLAGLVDDQTGIDFVGTLAK